MYIIIYIVCYAFWLLLSDDTEEQVFKRHFSASFGIERKSDEKREREVIFASFRSKGDETEMMMMRNINHFLTLCLPFLYLLIPEE